MSLGIKQTPDILMPVGNVIPIVVDSSQSSEDNFKYKTQLQDFDGANWNDIATMYLYPDIDNDGFGIYDNSLILENYLTNNPQLIFENSVTDTDSIKSFRNIITEYIQGNTGATYTSDLSNTFTGVMQYDETWDYTSYEPGNAKLINFLSKKNVRKYSSNTWSTVNMYNKNQTNDFKIKLVVYTASTGTLYYSDFPIAVFDNKIYSLPLGVPNINSGSTVGVWEDIGGTPTSTDIIGSDAIRYTYQILDVLNSEVSEEITVTIDEQCSRQGQVEFVYRGELGSYENIIANMIDLQTFQTSFVESKYNHYDIDSNEKYTYTIGDRGRDIINRRTQESHAVNTDWMSDEEMLDILELLNSTDVYVREGSNLYPIIITNSKYERKLRKSHQLYNYTITFDMSFEKLSI